MGLKNKDGVDIKDVWKDGIKSYMGMSFNGFPNCFMIYSPHGKYKTFSSINRLTTLSSPDCSIERTNDHRSSSRYGDGPDF